jgi:hypothetical protein
MNGRRSNPTLRRRQLATALLLVSLSAPAWAAGTVSGTVTVPEGRSLEGALVTATGTTYKVFRTEVSEDGTYSLEVDPGTYTVAVAARGLAFGIAEKVQVSEGQTVTQEFALEVPQPFCIVKSTAPIPLTEDINAPAFADAVELRLDSGHYLANEVNFDQVSNWLGPATIGGRVRLKYSEQTIHVAAELTFARPNVNFGAPNRQWTGNSLEVAIQDDPQDPERTAYEADHNWKLIVGLGARPDWWFSGRLQAAPAIGDTPASIRDYLLVKNRPAGDGNLVRLDIPFAFLRKADGSTMQPPKDGDLGALTIAINNSAPEASEEEQIRQFQLTLTGQDVNTPAYWRPIMFCPTAP